MKRSPLIPFLMIAIFGILLMLSISFFGVTQQAEILEDDEENGEEEEEEFEDPIEHGEAVYEESCLQCHGDNLEGGSGPAIDGYDADDTLQAIEEGPGSMPAGTAEGEDAEAVAEYVENYE
ncbi:cytochrome c550 [Salsuginibacillus halophilus]|uniref:Cytochrome c550 n=1 Tax=Salsuginibacillus halophilus TaxID=517424 RepID=A0A2P8HFK1_9BACI|nr:cytochrome c [Salsuginibacillus halophilus]PSL45008.1 cytochrome c550 [Salsuginibacillus halophilus]